MGEGEEGGGKVVAKGGGTMLGRDKGGDDEFAIFTQFSPSRPKKKYQITQS